MTSRSNSTTDKISSWILTKRWLWVLITIIMVGVSFMGMKNIYLDPDARVFFDPKNPDRIALDRFESSFAKDDNLMFVVVPKDGETFTPETLAAIGDITENTWLLPFVRRVDSVTNFQYSYAEGDEMIIRDLIPDPENVTEQEAAAAKKIALNEIVLTNAIVSETGHVSQVQVMFRLPGEDPETEVPSIIEETQILKQAMLEKYPNIDIKLSGSTVMNNQFSVSGQEDASTLTPAMLLSSCAPDHARNARQNGMGSPCTIRPYGRDYRCWYYHCNWFLFAQFFNFAAIP